MNRIQLKNVKYAAFNSHETHCYEASVYFDGKKVGHVSNEGHGGCDYQHPSDKDGWAKMEAYIETLPDIVTDWDDPQDPSKKFTMKQSLEHVCNDLVNDYLTGRDLKRLLSKRVVYRNTNGTVMQTGTARNKTVLRVWIEQIAAKDTVKDILNTMAFDDALEIYKAI